MPDVVFDDIMVKILILCDFVSKNIELQRIGMQEFKILAGSLEVEFHIVLWKVVYFITETAPFCEETNQVITHDKRMLKTVIQHVFLSLYQFVRTSHYLLIVIS